MQERLSKTLLYTYGIPDLFFVLMVQMESYYFAAFLTDYAQFPMATVGTILWITGVVDIACALLAGVILQKTNLRFGGKYRSWFLVGPPLIAPLFILQFTKIGGEVPAVFVIITSFLMSHLLWNVVSTAGGAMVGRLSRNPDERTILSASRAQGMSASGLIFSLTGPALILYLSSYTSKITAFSITVAIYGVLMILGYIYIYRITAGRDPYDETPGDSGPQQSLGEIFGLVLKNPPLLMLIVAETFRNAFIMIATAFAFYYFEYGIRNIGFMSVFLLASSIANLSGTFLATWIGLKLGKRKSYWVFLLLAAAGFASSRLVGGNAWTFTVVFSLSSLLAMVSNSMSTALFIDTVIYGEWKTGKNIQAFTMALLNLPIKLGILIRSGIITVGLTAIGFVSNSTPTPEVSDGILDIMSFSPAAVCLLAAVIFYFGYRIEDRQVLEMQEEIARRRPVPAVP